MIKIALITFKKFPIKIFFICSKLKIGDENFQTFLRKSSILPQVGEWSY